MEPQFSTFTTSSVGSECRILGGRWLPAQEFRDSVMFVIAARVSVTSWTWRCSRRQFTVVNAQQREGDARV